MRRFAIWVLVSCLAFGFQASGQNLITTVAGSNWVFPTDVTVALNAPLGSVSGVAVDSQGDIYVADSSFGRVFVVGVDGSIRIVAGNGTAGFSGDGGPAASAALSNPYGVAVDSSGNLFIADEVNNRIRKVSASGVITTVAGRGTGGFSGDGGPATSGTLYRPNGVAVDGSGNLFIADTNNHRIRKVSASGIIGTVAGNGKSGFSGDAGPATAASLAGPMAVAVDGSGNLFIADTGNSRIRKVAANGIITTVAGGGNDLGDGGPAASASLNGPNGVAVDGSGNLFIADTKNNRIRKVSANGVITTVAGGGTVFGDGGPAASASLNGPTGVAVDGSGSLLIADSGNGLIRKVSAGGVIATVAGKREPHFSGDGGPATSAWLYGPGGAAVDSSGNLFIADTGNIRVRKVSASGIITTVAGNGATPGDSLSAYFGVGAFSGDGGPATSASLSLPTGVAVDASGNLFIADAYNHRIRKVSASGIITTVAGSGAFGPFNGGFSGDGGPATSAVSHEPWGVAVDGSGDLLFVERGGFRVRKVSASGIITTVAGNGTPGSSGDGGPATSASLLWPLGVAVDTSGTHCYIADSGNNRIRMVPLPPTPSIAPGGIAPVYSTAPTIQPGEWVSIYGKDLAGSTATWNGDFPKSLGGTSVTINGKAASLSFVSPTQINLQAADDTATGAVPVVVITAGGGTAATVTLAPFAPSFFLLDGKHAAGIILRPNGSGAYGGGAYDIIGPTGNFLGYPTVAAKAGDTVELFAVGLGPTNPAVPAGKAFSGAAPTTNPVTLLIGNASVTPVFAGLSSAGLYQINLTVPAGLGTGDVPFVAAVGGARTPANVVMSLQ